MHFVPFTHKEAIPQKAVMECK
uniref:Uncharacterized protein n=1 Tax=Arundo donax TaxID=35708 RepID=A0A0A9AU88_ARUDO